MIIKETIEIIIEQELKVHLAQQVHKESRLERQVYKVHKAGTRFPR